MNIKKELKYKGYIFLPEWELDSSLEKLADSLGEVITISNMNGYSQIPNIQTITPKNYSKKLKNQYSGYYGLDKFPLHTDLAHWSNPPEFLILRCIKGFKDVSTKILPLNLIFDFLCGKGLHKAVFSTRKKSNIRSCLLPLLVNKTKGIRWDSLFLEPKNKYAVEVKNSIESEKVLNMAIDIHLVNYGDTLILNNHLNLHSRSNIPIKCFDRQIERIYFN